MGLAKTVNRVLITIPAKITKIKAVSAMLLAESLLCSPFLRATSADTATLVAKNRESPRNLGWVVRPTAATAFEPRELTMKESTRPTNATKKDSRIAGHAMEKALLKVSFLGKKFIISTLFL